MSKIKFALILSALAILFSALTSGQTCPKRIGQLNTLGNVTSGTETAKLISNGSTVFFAGGSNPSNPPLMSGLIRSIGVTPAGPSYIGLCETNQYLQSVYAMASSQTRLITEGNGAGRYCVLDASDPSTIVLLGCNTPIIPIDSRSSMAANGNYLYVLGKSNGGPDSIFVLDTSIAGNVQVVTQKSLTDYPYGIDAQANSLYVSSVSVGAINSAKLVIFDITNPINPIEKGSLALLSSFSSGRVVKALGDIAFVGIEEAATQNTFVAIVDVSDPMSPQLLNMISAGICGPPTDIAINGSLLTVALNNCGVKIYDVSNVSSPQYLARYISQGLAYSLAFSGQTLALLNLYGNGIEFLDLSACGTTGIPPSAAFSFNPANPLVNETVDFVDSSSGNPTSWAWSFGDGGASTSQNPNHAYSSAGNYSVALTVTNAYGSSGNSQTITVTAPGQPPAANFNWTPPFPISGQSVAFLDQTTNSPTSWSWIFGDGGFSSAQNPSHIYASPGNYIAMLTASNQWGNNTISKTVSVGVAPIAAFSFQPTSPYPGDTVQFTDQSTGLPTSWSWSFGDSITSTMQNPSKIYSSAGNFTVSLTATNSYGSNTATQQIIVQAPGIPPVANFSWSPQYPSVGQSVSFIDSSSNAPTSWSWNFGDGGSSTNQNPTHPYASAGSYIVTLTASSAHGNNTTSKTVIVGVAPTVDFAWTPATANVSEMVQFSDQSTGSPTSWIWNFGDGGTSTSQNPSKVYSAAGTYNVLLTASNNYGSHSKTKQIIISLPCTSPTANFTWSPSTPLVGKQAQFTDTSTGTPTAWSWNFGDGGSSVAKNPMHSFATKGTYNVTLTASNACGSNSVTKAVTVKPASFP